MHYRILQEQLITEIRMKKKMRGVETTPSCAESIFRKLTRHVTGDVNGRSGYRSSFRSNEEWKLDRIIDLDEWSKFDQRGRSAILGDEEGQGPRSGKFLRTHVVHVAPGAPPLPLFSLGSLFIYLLLFRGPRIFFLPLGRPSAATEGAAKMQDL